MTHTIETLRARCEEIGECWEWTGWHSHNGHPMVKFDGKPKAVRRVIAELSGMNLTPDKKISTSCGSKCCINPGHIIIETRRMMMRRHAALGKFTSKVKNAKIAATQRKGPQAKITMEIARAIRASDATSIAEAAKYGIHHSKVWSIRNNRSWKEFEDNPWMGLGERA